MANLNRDLIELFQLMLNFAKEINDPEKIQAKLMQISDADKRIAAATSSEAALENKRVALLSKIEFLSKREHELKEQENSLSKYKLDLDEKDQQLAVKE